VHASDPIHAVADGWKGGEVADQVPAGRVAGPRALLSRAEESCSESVPEVVKATRSAAAAIPHAEVRVLDGHGHFAHKTDPALVAAIVRELTAT